MKDSRFKFTLLKAIIIDSKIDIKNKLILQEFISELEELHLKKTVKLSF